MNSPRLTVLDNGLRVMSQEVPHSELISLGLWVKAGSRHEDEHQSGIAHFLEHMAFKGTKTRSAKAIVEEIEQVGGDINAATGLDQTAYYAQVLQGSLHVAVELIADIVLNPVFRDEDMQHEAGVICQEILASHDQPDERVFDRAMLAAFPGQAVGRPVMGTAEIVSSLTADDLRAFMARHYNAGNMTLVAAGAAAHEELVALAAKHFQALPANAGGANAGATSAGEAIEGEIGAAASYCGGFSFDKKRFEQAHMIVGFEGVGFLGDEIFTAQVLNSALGGGMSSRLFQEVREQRGLAYHVYSFHTALEETGFFGAYAATDPREALSTTELIIEETMKIADKGIEPQELLRAKAQLRCGAAMVMESSSARAEQIARQILFMGRVLSQEELLAKTEAVTIEDCMALAQKMLVNSQMSLSVVGAGQKIGGFERLYSCLKKPAHVEGEPLIGIK